MTKSVLTKLAKLEGDFRVDLVDRPISQIENKELKAIYEENSAINDRHNKFVSDYERIKKILEGYEDTMERLKTTKPQIIQDYKSVQAKYMAWEAKTKRQMEAIGIPFSDVPDFKSSEINFVKGRNTMIKLLDAMDVSDFFK